MTHLILFFLDAFPLTIEMKKRPQKN